MAPLTARFTGGTRARRLSSAMLLLGVGAAICGAPRAQLPASLNNDDALHVLNRITYGATTSNLATVTGSYQPNYYRWMKLQVHPTMVAQNPDLALALGPTVMNPLTLPTSHTSAGSTLADIQRAQIVRALLSTRQLQEVMARFWDNHFNTSYFSVRGALNNQAYTTGAISTDEYAAWLEFDDNEFYRANAFGTFFQLLKRTTDSPAMMLYLNQNISKCPTPNQNYARESLELYSMGPNYAPTGAPNYSQSDIVEVAEILSGWNMPNTHVVTPTAPHASVFVRTNHCNLAHPTLFNGTPQPANIGTMGNGMGQKDALLSHLANAEGTKDFICRKLVAYFISEAAAVPGAETALIANMKSSWATDGDMQSVILDIFNSPAFFRAQYRWQRARTPFEKVIWWPRTWDATLTRLDGLGIDLAKLDAPYSGLQRIGELPFTFPSPDGFPLENDEQPGSSIAIETYRYNQQILLSIIPDNLLIPPPFNYYPFHPALLFHPDGLRCP